ncbi:MAG TPA: hypothetical protein VIF83_08130, partial [Gemmatimonadaceae bacterium]
TIVLYPVLKGAAASAGDRRIIALFGPRGLSSLLLTLLPVFAGVPGAERLFTITCLVVLLSVVLHGTGMTLVLRKYGVTAAAPAAPVAASPVVATPFVTAPQPAQRSLLPLADESPSAGPTESSDKITLDEYRELKRSGEEVILVDARADRNYRRSDIQAAGSVRLNPEDPVRDATRLRLSQRATLVVYCA